MANLTSSAHRALDTHEPLIFEQSRPNRRGTDLPPIPEANNKLGSFKRSEIPLPGLSEPQVVRHYTRLSRQNFSIDGGFYPLGSCTMKHNPRLNEKVARLPGFANIHPLQPEDTVQGALELMHVLSEWLTEMTGMESVALSPAAGAHGELCGMMAIRAAVGNERNTVLVPESAHGTNPATAAACGFKVKSIPANEHGRVDLEAFKAAMTKDVAAIMITNPNTCGLFEGDIREISSIIHENDGYVYGDGANFNAIAGLVDVAALGVDCMHINLHKTFSTPHGGGGPGSGPVVFSQRLAAHAPGPMVQKTGDYYQLIEKHGFGRIKAFHGQFGTFVRALSYMMAMGIDGIAQASKDAVLNANYLRVKLSDMLHVPFKGMCMHEVLFSEKDLGVSTLDFAKALIDAGFHPMTVYFPLVVKGAMLMEPTESESKETLDEFIAVIRELATAAKEGREAEFKEAPIYAPTKRMDETKAAREPKLVWQG